MNRHDEIREEMLRRINAGEWPVGADIPNEVELVAEFSAARGTIQRALSSLVEQGLIERRKRAGSRVVPPRAHASKLSIPLIREEIETRGFGYGYKLLERRVLPASKGTGKRLRLVCLHLADGRPFQLERRDINLAALPQAERESFQSAGPNEWLVREVPATRIVTRISAEAADAATARLLDLPEASPLLIVARETFKADAPLTEVRMLHPADSYEVTTVSF
ncbi:UTRA domain-containing protein [Paracoccus aurantiacus]|uniref:UTRA domain-containing protein n=1 Tax=Paracoccus aurantiacus TaxID=2599412 RepID=A0A5C6S2F8_9RHOB|nr:GntR family transcriptional regulator [Paracoccus aurantiacus]TXB69018.1 UTRA domain-containing protein [Paracoccus aurantiacus]